MPVIVWDEVGDRRYETGLDRGVLYLPDGSAVPWNGLVSVVEKIGRSSSPVYYDGMKINDLVTLGEFSAIVRAVTYPEEFSELESQGSLRKGFFVGDQPPKAFGLSYRTKIGNGLEGEDAGYKLHLVYNATALPNDKTYASLSSDPNLTEFVWDLVTVPEEIPGFRPSAHFEVDSRNLDPWLLSELETMLYGAEASEASLPPLPELIAFVEGWYRVKITDNGDGSWTATSDYPGLVEIDPDDPDAFIIEQANVTYPDEDTFVISDTLDVSDIS